MFRDSDAGLNLLCFAVIVTDSVAEAETLLEQTYSANKDAEKKAFDDAEKKKRDEEEASRKKVRRFCLCVCRPSDTLHC
jgi:hypothetical protein